MPLDATTLAEAYGAGRIVADAVKATVIGPVGEVVNAHVKAFAEAKLGPLLRRVLPLDEAAKLAGADVQARLATVLAELLVEPSPAIAAGVVEALRTRAGEPEIRAMFADLLASACRTDRADAVHVAFVEIVRQLAPDDARILGALVDRGGTLQLHDYLPPTPARGVSVASSYYAARALVTFATEAGATTPEAVEIAVGNLERLGVCERTQDESPKRNGQYTGFLRVTPFGRRFCVACIADVRPHFAG